MIHHEHSRSICTHAHEDANDDDTMTWKDMLLTLYDISVSKKTWLQKLQNRKGI